MIFMLVAVIIVSVIIVRVPYKKPLCKNCNVILVSIDTLSALHLPCYGYERDTAPNLCAFAKKNILFTNSYSQSSITLDSHISIFTSLYPHTHKLNEIFAQELLDERYKTLPQLLRSNGYNTIYHAVTEDSHLPLNRGLERGFDIIEPGSDINTWKNAYPKLLKNAEEKKPTFLFLHTYATHVPYLTGHEEAHPFTEQKEYPNIPLTENEYYELSDSFFKYVADSIIKSPKIIGEDSAAKADEKNVLIAQKLKNAKSFSDGLEIFNSLPDFLKSAYFYGRYIVRINKSDPDQIKYFKALYDEQIYNMDKQLKNLLDLIEDPRLSKNTILIITSDHGEEFMEHGAITHGTNLYKTATQVPLIMSIPGLGPKKVTNLVQGIDIYPTLADLVGINLKSFLQGIDLVPLIEGKPGAAENRYLVSEIQNLVSIQNFKYKLYYNKENKGVELYNIILDSGEKRDISSANKEVSSNLLSKLKQ